MFQNEKKSKKQTKVRYSIEQKSFKGIVKTFSGQVKFNWVRKMYYGYEKEHLGMTKVFSQKVKSSKKDQKLFNDTWLKKDKYLAMLKKIYDKYNY